MHLLLKKAFPVVIVNSEDASCFVPIFRKMMGNKKSPIDSKTKNNFHFLYVLVFLITELRSSIDRLISLQS
jgi:hypothetical protein